MGASCSPWAITDYPGYGSLLSAQYMRFVKHTKVLVACDFFFKVFFSTSWCGRESMWHSQCVVECQGDPVYNKSPEFHCWSLHLYYFYSFSVQSSILPLSISIWQFLAFIVPNAESSEVFFKWIWVWFSSDVIK